MLKTADLFGISHSKAIRYRLKYLANQVALNCAYIQGKTNAPPMKSIPECFDEIVSLCKRRDNLGKKIKGTVTDDMIEAASNYPVERLVELVRGKTKAWCHEDKNPSAYHGTRTNTIVCPVCDKKFNAIQILMIRDGKTFFDAVKELCCN